MIIVNIYYVPGIVLCALLVTQSLNSNLWGSMINHYSHFIDEMKKTEKIHNVPKATQ